MKPFAFTFASILSAFFVTAPTAPAQDGHQEILLYPNGAPGSEGKDAPETWEAPTARRDYGMLRSVHKPSITVYLPPKEKATGAAVLVIPGGGHSFIAMDTEGYNVAQWLSDHGIAGFVMKYRLARETNSTYTIDGHEVPDVQRALRYIRSRAEEWNIKPDRLGVMGFSAGGDLAMRVSMKFDEGNESATDAVDKQGCKPAFQALIYPGGLNNLAVTSNSPPAFLACGYNDGTNFSVGIANAYIKFKQARVPAELHIYSGVGHGFGVKPSHHDPVDQWPAVFTQWLGQIGVLKKPL